MAGRLSGYVQLQPAGPQQRRNQRRRIVSLEVVPGAPGTTGRRSALVSTRGAVYLQIIELGRDEHGNELGALARTARLDALWCEMTPEERRDLECELASR